MRLIDADAAIKRIKGVACSECNDYGGIRCRACYADVAMSAIDDAPDVDAVPVIRCAACYWCSASGFCGRHGHPVTDDFFCAHGTTEIWQKPGPKKKAEMPPETKPEAYCGSTGRPCCMCVPGPCDHRRM